MAVSVVQSKAASSTEPFVASFSTLPTAGNAVVVVFNDNGDTSVSTVTDNQGNTYTAVVNEQDSTAANTFAGVYWCSSIGSPSGTFTVTMTPSNAVGNKVGGFILEVSGIGAVNQTGAANDGGLAPTSLTVTGSAQNTAANCLCVYSMVLKGAAGNLAFFSAGATAGWTNSSVLNANDNGIESCAGYKVVTSVETSQAVSQTWTTGTACAGVLATFSASGSPTFTAQTITSSKGTLGAATSYATSAFTVTSAEGTIAAPQLAVSLSGETATFIEGSISSQFVLSPQNIVSAEGTITAALSGNVSLALGALTAQFVEGIPLFNVSYLLDQNTLTLVGQTAAFSEGAIVSSPTYTFSNQTITSTEGTISQTSELSLSLMNLNITSVEGVITAQSGSSFNANLGAQTIASSEFFAVPPATVSYPVTAETITSTEGNITFSNTTNFTVQIGSQAASFIEGIIVPQVPIGTGPPLFIPPTLGKPVTTRTLSWAEMAQRAWGSEFRAPDHRIYQFSGGNYKDSTDMGTTGIYSPNLGTPDNP